MASENSYTIVDSGVRGMVAIATRDIMPGELVVEEKEPLLSFTQADRERYKNCHEAMDIAFAAYDVFARNLSAEKRAKFVTLYGPTTGAVASNLRKFLHEQAKIRYGPEGNFKTFTPVEVEMMVKVLQVVRLNMFGKEGEDYRVYSEITRFSHSCASNCQYSFKGQAIVCYARCSIQAGDELTISYNSSRDMEPCCSTAC